MAGSAIAAHPLLYDWIAAALPVPLVIIDYPYATHENYDQRELFPLCDKPRTRSIWIASSLSDGARTMFHAPAATAGAWTCRCQLSSFNHCT